MDDETVDSNILHRYQKIKKLGKGAYGVVWKVKEKKTGKLCALKKIFNAFTNFVDA